MKVFLNQLFILLIIFIIQLFKFILLLPTRPTHHHSPGQERGNYLFKNGELTFLSYLFYFLFLDKTYLVLRAG